MAAVDYGDIEANAGLARLRSYLSDRWVIEPPVLIRPLWHSPHDRRDAYHFVLRRGDSVNLLLVVASPETERFIAERQMATNRL